MRRSRTALPGTPPVDRPGRVARIGRQLLAVVGIVTLLSTVTPEAALAWEQCTDYNECGGGGGSSYGAVTNTAWAESATVGVPFSFQYRLEPSGSSVAVTSGSLPRGSR